MNPTQPIDPNCIPCFDDDAAIALAVAETGLPEAKVRAVVEATLWFQVCAGATGVTGGDSEARVAGYLARFPNMFEGRNDEVLTISLADEATFISETTDVFEDEVTRILAAVRTYEAEIGIIDASAVEDYREWRVAWLTHIVRPRVIKVDGKFVVYSFVEALRREQGAST